jgi:hypothetical protein
MFIRDIRHPLRLFFKHDIKQTPIVTYIHINSITHITVIQNDLTIFTSDQTYRYSYKYEKDAENMGERILNYIQACKRNISKDTYLHMTELFCPDVQEIVDNQVVPRNYISYKDYKKQSQQQRWDRPSPDSSALIILQEYEKSLTVIKEPHLK